jgi:formate/nitrite transporter
MPGPEPYTNSLDSYAPGQIAARVETAGVAKAKMASVPLFALGIMAGVFIAFGAMFFTLVMSDASLSFAVGRLLGGVAFSLGLILVVVGGAELFTGNNMIVMAWAARKVSLPALMRNWIIVYVANFVGALGSVVLVWWSGILSLNDMGATAAAIAAGKVALPFEEAFVRGILCNALVCLAVWLCFSARRVSGKILSIIWPITAFVALGFEHSIANMYLIPIGMLAGDAIDPLAFLGNIIPVTLGNIAGGAGGVALIYWLVYLRRSA